MTDLRGLGRWIHTAAAGARGKGGGKLRSLVIFFVVFRVPACRQSKLVLLLRQNSGLGAYIKIIRLS